MSQSMRSRVSVMSSRLGRSAIFAVCLIGVMGLANACSSDAAGPPATSGATVEPTEATALAATTTTSSTSTTVEPTTSSSSTTTSTSTTTTSTSTTSTTSTTTTSTTLAPTTTIDPMEAAGQAYYLISLAVNTTTADIDAAFPNGVPFRDAPEYCTLVAPALEKFATDLRVAEWPAEVQDEVDALISTTAEQAGLYYECARAPGTSAAQTPIFARIEDASTRGGAAASALRAALGVPIARP